MVTIEMATTTDAGIADVIRELYTYYVPGVEIPSDEELVAMVE